MPPSPSPTPLPPSLRAAQRYCHRSIRQASSHFTSSFRLLPLEKRKGMEAVYAFCRVVDDAVDQEGISIEQAQAQLNRWRRELKAMAAGAPTHPIAVALAEAIRLHRIPLEYFEKLIRGVEMDLTRQRYQTFEELKTYCEHVASVVGLISVKIFGCHQPAADQYATHLGIALQLTNILRDVKEDAQQGRIYLPHEDLIRFGCSEEMLLSGKRSPEVERLMAFESERAREYFREAETAFQATGRSRKLLPAQIMRAIYEQILESIESLQYDVFSHRVSIPKRRQLWIATRLLVGLGG